MIYYYSISDFTTIVFLPASTSLSILPPASCDYSCLPASLFSVHLSTPFIYLTVLSQLFLRAYFIIHFVSYAFLNHFFSTDLVISFSVCVKVKQPWYRPELAWRVELYPFVSSALEGGGWSAPRLGRFTPGKDPVPIVQEAGWAPGPAWTYAKNRTPTRIWSPEHPVCSQSLYQLSYPVHSLCVYIYHTTSVCVSVTAFVADCLPISLPFIHPFLMNSYWHQVGTLQWQPYMVSDSNECHYLDRYDDWTILICWK
jgi:hypothetical protein